MAAAQALLHFFFFFLHFLFAPSGDLHVSKSAKQSASQAAKTTPGGSEGGGDSDRCDWVKGDGKGGTEKRVGYVWKDPEKCAEMVPPHLCFPETHNTEVQ